jgi:hypothetical protein
MKRMKKLVLTTAALAALAVGGAAFASAQNAAVATQVPTHQSAVDLRTPGDTPDATQADPTGSGDQSDAADAPDSAEQATMADGETQDD